MEHFFNAHADKKRRSNIKNNNRLKHSLRLMLNAYDRNDTNAIRTAAEYASETEDSDANFTLGEESDVEQVQHVATPSPVHSARSSSPRPTVSSGQSLGTIRDQPPTGLKPMSTFASFRDEEDVSHITKAISDISESDNDAHEEEYSIQNQPPADSTPSSGSSGEDVSDMIKTTYISESGNEACVGDYSIVNASDLDSSSHDLDSFNMVNSSLDNTNTSSSTFSEFDANGHLASHILEKINARRAGINDESECETNTAPSASGFITRIKRKRPKKMQSAAVSEIKEDLSVPKSKKSKKLKQYNEEDITPYLSDSEISQTSVITVPKRNKLLKKTKQPSVYFSLDTSEQGVSNNETKKARKQENYNEEISEQDESTENTIPKLKKLSTPKQPSLYFSLDTSEHNGSKSEISVPKTKKSRKIIHTEEFPDFISFDASDLELPSFLSSFRHYKYSTSKNPKVFHSGANYSYLFDKEQGLNEAEINECSEETSESDLYESNLSPEQDPTEVSINNTIDGEPPHEDIVVNGIEYQDEVNAEESSASTSIEVYQLRNGCVVVLKHPANLYLHGKVKVTSLCGTVDVMGYRLQGNSTQVYAPRFSFAHTFKTVATECSQYGLFAKLTALGMAVLKTENIVVSLQEFDSVIYLEPLPDYRMDFIEKEFSSAEFFHMSNKMLVNEQFPEAARILSCSLYADKPYKSFEENAIWPEVVKHGIGKNSKGIICGGKGTGKSTFLKYYINRLVSQGPVVVIDLDPGQAEFTVAGNVSVTVVEGPVIGPNFTHLLKPRRMLNVGLINVLENLEHYISAITQLIRHVTEEDEYSQLPWIVNTMGMSNSLGLKLIIYAILLLKPTFLVQMDSNVQKNCFEMLLNLPEVKRMFSETYEEDEMFEAVRCPLDLTFQYYMSSHAKTARGDLSPRDKRHVCFLSYFSGALSKNIHSLLAVRPYVVQLKSLKISTSCKVQDDAITSVINGKIVALCEEKSDDDTLSKTFPSEENATLLCHGHGLVRGADLDTDSLYIITAENWEILSRVNLLMYCEAHPDLSLSDTGLPLGTFVPYRAVLQPHNRQLMKSPKRRFNPIQLLKLKRGGGPK